MVSPVSGLEVDARALEKAVERMQKFEPAMRKQLVKDIKVPMKRALPDVVNAVPSQPPIGRTTPLQSGVARNWGSVKGLIRTYPNAKPGRAIALMGVDGVGAEMAKYLMMTETAGSRNPGGLSRRGKSFINALNNVSRMNGRGGRFVWKEWLQVRPQIRSDVINILDRYIKRFNKRGRI